jgi:hypothetical protein
MTWMMNSMLHTRILCDIEIKDNIKLYFIFLLISNSNWCSFMPIYILTLFPVCPPICLELQSTTLGNTLPVLTPCEYIMRLLRKYGVHSNERQMLLSADDQMVAIQLCLAEINKQVFADTISRL